MLFMNAYVLVWAHTKFGDNSTCNRKIIFGEIKGKNLMTDPNLGKIYNYIVMESIFQQALMKI